MLSFYTNKPILIVLVIRLNVKGLPIRDIWFRWLPIVIYLIHEWVLRVTDPSFRPPHLYSRSTYWEQHLPAATPSCPYPPTPITRYSATLLEEIDTLAPLQIQWTSVSRDEICALVLYKALPNDSSVQPGHSTLESTHKPLYFQMLALPLQWEHLE